MNGRKVNQEMFSQVKGLVQRAECVMGGLWKCEVSEGQKTQAINMSHS